MLSVFAIRRRTLSNLRKEYDTIEKELKTLRETFNHRQDTWIKEKLVMQVKVKLNAVVVVTSEEIHFK
jgi:hypothetical protein